MKRSKSISLLLMGSLAVGPVSCSSENSEEFMTFGSVKECVSSGIFSQEDCDTFLRDAMAQTPRFASQEECEAAFGAGNCGAPEPAVLDQPAPSADVADAEGTQVQAHSGSMWMPMFMGFMAGRFLSGGQTMHGSQGLYKDSAARPGADARSYRTSTGATVTSDSKGRVTSPTSSVKQGLSHNAKPVQARGGSSSRGGFSGGSKVTGGGS